MKKAILPILLLLVNIPAVFAQTFYRWDNVKVIEKGDTLQHAWTGGLNTPRFSTIDLNGDNCKDLYIFDGSSSMSITFLNKGIAGKSDYIYAPEYEPFFPEMRNWALLKDYNNDGYEDIFTASAAKIFVYSNDYAKTDQLGFTNVTDRLVYHRPGGQTTNIYAGNVDIPGLADVDGDGDLDILSFDILAVRLDYYKNMDVESGFPLDSLYYVKASDCWGDFAESNNTNEVSLGAPCRSGSREEGGFLLKEPVPPRVQHAGSTVLAFDPDHNGDIDLLLGDASYDGLVFLQNGGNDIIIEQDTAFPYNSRRVLLPTFPASFYLDVNNDGLKDLLVAPDLPTDSRDTRNVWLYENTGTKTNDVFTFRSESFLAGDMVDVGTGAYPALLDHNADSLPDLLIGNTQLYDSSGNAARLFLFENTGTRYTPVFELVDSDYLSLSQYNYRSIAPDVGDLDRDGDDDLILGLSSGEMRYFQNTAGTGQPVNFTVNVTKFLGANVGNNAVPQIVDVNRDGKSDLLIGNKAGNIFYYENDTSVAGLSLSEVTDSFGHVNTKVSIYYDGNCSPALVDLQKDGTYTLFAGSGSGQIFRFMPDSNPNDTFQLINAQFSEINVGRHTNIKFGDINADAIPDMLIGNSRGGVALYTAGSVVWPGDANNNGIADMWDIFSIGLGFDSTGTKRGQMSSMWDGYPAKNWSQNFSGGLNYKYADANGDGTIDSLDVSAISQNYGNSHNLYSKPVPDNQAALTMQIQFDRDSAEAGDTVSAKILLNASQPADVYGIACELHFNEAVVVNGSETVSFDSTWIGGKDSTLRLSKVFSDKGRIDAGIVKTNHQNSKGSGEIFSVNVVIENFLPDTGQSVNMLISNISHASLVLAGGSEVPVSVQGDTVYLKVKPNAVRDQKYAQIKVLPNPVKDYLIVDLGREPKESFSYEISNYLGQRIRGGQLSGKQNYLSIADLKQGVYLVTIKTQSGTLTRKFVKLED